MTFRDLLAQDANSNFSGWHLAVPPVTGGFIPLPC